MMRKYCAAIIAVIIVMAGTIPAFALFGKNLEPIVVQLSDDPTIVRTANYVKSQIRNSHIIQAFDIPTLFAVIESTYNTIFYVGHGCESGIMLKSTTLEWGHLKDAAMNSPSLQHLVLACYSGNPKLGHGRSWFGFNAQIDSQIGADLLLSVFFASRGNYPSFDLHRFRALDGILNKMIRKTEKPTYLMPINDGGGGGSSTPDYDFIYCGIYWSAYSVDPNHEIFYDHPSYDYYYQSRGVGPANAFTVDAGLGVRADHIDRGVVAFWKLGGLFTIAEFLFDLGVGLAMTFFGFEAGAVVVLIAAAIAALGFTASWIAEVFQQDETGSGWVFYKDVENGVVFKIGCMWWLFIADGVEAVGFLPIPVDGHYIR